MYAHRRKMMIEDYGDVLQIHKKGKYYVCSKERLEHIDFKIVEAPRNYYNSWHC